MYICTITYVTVPCHASRCSCPVFRKVVPANYAKSAGAAHKKYVKAGGGPMPALPARTSLHPEVRCPSDAR